MDLAFIDHQIHIPIGHKTVGIYLGDVLHSKYFCQTSPLLCSKSGEINLPVYLPVGFTGLNYCMNNFVSY